MKMPYRLHYAPDNASLIIRLALEQMAQPYETVLVDRAARAQHSAAYLALNPNALVPVLETAQGAIFETGAILLWLTERHGQLAPAPGHAERGDFLKWLFFVSNTLHPALRMLFYPDAYAGADPLAQSALVTHMRGETARHLHKLDDLAEQGPPWFAGEAPSVLDFYVACALRWIALYPQKGVAQLAVSNWPRLEAMVARLETFAAVRVGIDAEGLGPRPFTAPDYPNPPEGSPI